MRKQQNNSRKKTGINVHWGAALKTDPQAKSTGVSFEDFTEKKYVEMSFDMVVFCIDVMPPDGLAALAEAAGVNVREDGYFEVTGANDQKTETSTKGIFVVGCGSGPKNIRESASDAEAAADAAVAQLNPMLLEGEAGEGQEAATQMDAPPDEMRAQIEKLLYALINQ